LTEIFAYISSKTGSIWMKRDRRMEDGSLLEGRESVEFSDELLQWFGSDDRYQKVSKNPDLYFARYNTHRFGHFYSPMLSKIYKKLSCCCNSRSYCVRRTVYWQAIGFDYKLTNGRYARSDWTDRVYERTQTLYSSVTIERDRLRFSTSRSQWITERNTTGARLIVCLKNSCSRFLQFVFFCAFCG